MKDYRELAECIYEKVIAEMYDPGYDTPSETEETIGVIQQIITDHFTPDGELVERAMKHLIGIYESEPDKIQLHLTLNPDAVRIAKAMASFHFKEREREVIREKALQELACQSQELDMGYGKPTPIDYKGISARAKAFYECSASKYVTQPVGTWDMLADFAISELSRQGKEDAEKSGEWINVEDLEKVKPYYNPPFRYDGYGTQVWDKDNNHVLDIRGYGRLQKIKGGEKIQDALGRLVTQFLNRIMPEPPTPKQ